MKYHDVNVFIIMLSILIVANTKIVQEKKVLRDMNEPLPKFYLHALEEVTLENVKEVREIM